jgi:hypothetical protein
VHVAELPHASTPPVPIPVIPLPVANATPIRLLDNAPGPAPAPSTGRISLRPDPVHLISVPDINLPTSRAIEIPNVNQAALPGIPDGTGSGDGSGKGKSSGGTQAAGTQPGGTQSAGTGTELASNGNGGSAAPAVVPPASLQGALLPGTVRIDRPKNGRFSVVVMGNSAVEAYPEAAGLLSGRIIYSVYVRAGGKKEWILQYCLPKAAEQSLKVRGSAVPIEAPYPFVIYRPALVSNDTYVIIHGFVTAVGRFEQLTTVGDVDSTTASVLLKTLANWEFRPASRDGEPSAVEIALIIPRDPS